jgi:Zn-dependent protease
MRDPLTWSFPIGRFFGITVRIHLLFLIFMIATVWRGMMNGYAAEALLIQFLLFLSVLLHEFGHCFAARQVDGDATEILMWPLGGLASVDIPNTPRAHFITTAGGPAVNLVLCCASGAALLVYKLIPPFNPLWEHLYFPALNSWESGALEMQRSLPVVASLMAQLFYINWILFWFNILLVGFPLDGGRLLQAILWPRVGFRQATIVVIFSGWIIALLLSLYAFISMRGDEFTWVGNSKVLSRQGNVSENLLLFWLALFIYVTCKQQFILLETGALGDEPLFGYDFSQGYTSLERESSSQPRRPRQSFWQRWLERRAARKRQREEERRQAEATRVDQLLAKVQQEGMQSLTDEERRFLNRISARLRNRQQP